MPIDSSNNETTLGARQEARSSDSTSFAFEQSLARWSTAAATILTGLSVLSAVLYLIGYWSNFNINVFEYVDLGDVAVTAIPPLAGSLFAVAFYATIWGFSLALTAAVDTTSIVAT
jgi:hypothetical protein